MLKLVVVCVLVAAAVAQTDPPTTHAHKTHNTHGPNVHETFRFFLDHHDHKMLINTMQECFVFSLTKAQIHAAATPTGVRELEIKLVSLLKSGTQTPMVTADITKVIAHHCGKHPVIAISHKTHT